MEDTFNSALRQYKTNYVQFATTGDTKYQKMYEASQELIESILQEPPKEEPYDIKPIREKSYIASREVVSPVVQIPSWQYWALGSLAVSAFVLSRF